MGTRTQEMREMRCKSMYILLPEVKNIPEKAPGIRALLVTGVNNSALNGLYFWNHLRRKYICPESWMIVEKDSERNEWALRSKYSTLLRLSREDVRECRKKKRMIISENHDCVFVEAIGIRSKSTKITFRRPKVETDGNPSERILSWI